MSLELKKQFEAEYSVLQTLQKDFSLSVQNRQKLDAQYKENEMVLQELKSLKDDAVVYKAVGPTLIKQDREESLQNVEKRIEFIMGEISRMESKLKDLDERMNKKRQDVLALQQKLQSAVQPPSQELQSVAL